MINIPSTVEDHRHRYKMTKMELKQESRGNGVKTNIFNLDDVARDLRVPSEFIIKFICAELGVSKEKKSIIKGRHEYPDILKVLDQFIHKFLLCKKCEIPETTLYADGKLLASKCRACGHKSSLDNSHKVTNYMLKNLPKNMGEIEEKDYDMKDSKKKSKKSKKKKEENKEEIEEKEKAAKKAKKDKKKKKKESELSFESEEIVALVAKVKESLAGNETDLEKMKEFFASESSEIGREGVDLYLAFTILIGEKILVNWPKYQKLLKSLMSSDSEGVAHYLQNLIHYF